VAKRWLSIRVDLIGGRGEILEPQPGRNFAVPPNCTFDQFGQAIDLAFARWDLSHLRQFTLEDGTLSVHEEMADELRGSAFGGGTIPRTMLLNEGRPAAEGQLAFSLHFRPGRQLDPLLYGRAHRRSLGGPWQHSGRSAGVLTGDGAPSPISMGDDGTLATASPTRPRVSPTDWSGWRV
jgi:hypothetical protein